MLKTAKKPSKRSKNRQKYQKTLKRVSKCGITWKKPSKM